MKSIAILVSGGGSNMSAIISAVRSGVIDADVRIVIASNHEAQALVKAEAAGIRTAVCSLTDYPSREARDHAIVRLLEAEAVELVVLAGYLGILTAELVDKFPSRIINIHPSLLPKFGGNGFHGIKVHEAVIAAGEARSGATVHYVDNGTDTGAIIAQRSLEVHESDTAASLQSRILNEIEHSLLVDVLAKLCAESV